MFVFFNYQLSATFIEIEMIRYGNSIYARSYCRHVNASVGSIIHHLI